MTDQVLPLVVLPLACCLPLPACLPSSASASACLPRSAGLLRLPGHHYPCPWHCWLVPLSFPVHLNMGRVPVDEGGLAAAQSPQGFSVDLFKLEFKCDFVFVSNLQRMANRKGFCKCILAVMLWLFLWVLNYYGKLQMLHCSKCVDFFSACNGSIFYGRAKNRYILLFELFVCSCVAVSCISCLLVVVYGGLEEGQWGAISVTRGPCPLSLQDVTSTCQCSLCWPIVKSITTYNHLYCKGAKELFHFCPYL